MISNYKIAIITTSDTRGIEDDLSGKYLEETLSEAGNDIVYRSVINDDLEGIKKELITATDTFKADLILTCGGTGLSKRDNTPQATLAIIDKEVPGISEALRFMSLQKTKRGMLSRGVSGIRNDTLIINMPGSPKACREYLEYLEDVLGHALGVLKGTDKDCGKER